jgi:hypothetical protein
MPEGEFSLIRLEGTIEIKSLTIFPTSDRSDHRSLDQRGTVLLVLS